MAALMTATQRDAIVSLAQRVHGEHATTFLTRLREEQPRPSVGDASRIIAGLLREQKALSAAKLPPGRYALTMDDGEVAFFNVDRPTTGKWAGRVFVSRVHGENLSPVRGRDGDRIKERLERDPTSAAALYGKTSGVCGLCHRTLTDPESRERGIGPVCATKVG